jgi:integrase
MATIRKKRGKWHVQIRRKGSPQLSRTFLRKIDGVQWANEFEARVERKDLPTISEQLDGLKVSDLIIRYCDTVLLSYRGYKNQKYVLDAFLRTEVARRKLSEVNASHFAAYRDERLKAVKPATVNRELSLLQRIFEVARREWAIALPNNPIKSLTKPKEDPPRERRLEPGEWEALMEACEICKNPWFKPALCFALETGMRRGEVLNAKWQDYSETAHTLYIPTTKNGHARTIPLSPRAIKILENLPSDRDDNQLIFPLSAEAVKLAWKRLTIRAGIKDLRFHDLRHEAVSRFFELGLSVPEVALISGHRDPRMLFRYTHLRAEEVAVKLEHV